jgi:hypothetical protein
MKINEALANVMDDVRSVGKTDRNTHQNYNFRGIDSVVNAVGPALRKHNIVVMPRVLDLHAENVTVGRNNTTMRSVTVTVEYQFVGPDGDSLVAVSVGEAMDSGDKATPKAMSVALRTCLLQALMLPTDEPDPDSYSYDRENGHAPAPAAFNATDPSTWAAKLAAADAKAAVLAAVGGDKAAAKTAWLAGGFGSAKTVDAASVRDLLKSIAIADELGEAGESF